MQSPYRLYGAELSPYSMKVRAYLTFKNIPFVWRARTQSNQDEFAAYAKLPLLPVLVDASEHVLQDSTPMIEALEAETGAPVLQPEDEALTFLSALVEDYADEWLNKAMFHYRWTGAADQQSAAARLTDAIFDGDPPTGREKLEASVRERMAGRLRHVGSNAETAPVIEASFERLTALLEAILARRPYLFGGRPCLADFGLAAQLGQMLSDPTPGAYLRARAPITTAWIERMREPRIEGPFEPFAEIADVHRALLTQEIAALYLPWMAANAEAVAEDSPSVALLLEGRPFTQAPQRYAAKALAALKRKRALVESEALAALLTQTGCAPYLEAAMQEEGGEESEDEEGGGALE